MKDVTISRREAVNKVAVAMSGGVDSSVAAYLLKQSNFDTIGISMQVWDYKQKGGSASRATCCSPSDFLDARRVADKVGIPYYVFDFEDTFKREVIDKFVKSYSEGITPNPCVDCNNRVKFKELRNRVLGFGFAKVATGHYARISKIAGLPALLRGKDVDKDQSYFLYGLKLQELEQTLFPVGDLTKHEVRELAKQAGLVTAEKPESQDICFVSGSVQDFLVKLGAKKPKGFLVTRGGQKIGEHQGVHNFTVGQRRGLGLGGQEEPLYVLEIDVQNNNVIIGHRNELDMEGFWVEDLNLVDPA